MYLDSVYCGDYREEIRKIPDSSVELVLTDPPYNISTSFRAEFPDRSDISHDFGEWDDGSVQPSDWVPEAKRVLTDNGVIVAFYDNRNIHQLISAVKDAGLEFRQKVYWHKSNPAPQIYGVKWQEAVEEAVIATVNTGRGHHYQNQRGQRHNVIQTPVCGNSEREDHPTQKPEQLFRILIKWWSQPEDIVLDPFTGTGTACVAAQQLGRHFIGIECQEKHVETAKNRLRQRSLASDW